MRENNVIWTLEGTIKDGQKEVLETLMQEMVGTVSKEPGTLHYEWTLAADGKSLHVYERYADEAATMAHLGTWSTFAERFMQAVTVTRFVVFSELPQKLKDAVAGLGPIYMKPIGGFAR
ncbi:MAG: antibiotic biosynthesis monooxygenase family protein [Bacteroidota bacterium]